MLAQHLNEARVPIVDLLEREPVGAVHQVDQTEVP